MSGCGLDELIDLAISRSTEELDSITYSYIKQHITTCFGCAINRKEPIAEPFIPDSQVIALTKHLLLTDPLSIAENHTARSRPWWSQDECLTSFSATDILTKTSSDPVLQSNFRKIVANLKQTPSSAKYTARVLESPLFHDFMKHKVPCTLVCVQESVIATLLDYLLTSVTPTRANVAVLLIESSTYARKHVQMNLLPTLCQSIQAGSEDSISCLLVLSKVLEGFLNDCAQYVLDPPGNHKKSVKFVFKQVWSQCLTNMTLDSSSSCQSISTQVVKYLCALRKKGCRKFKKAAAQWIKSGTLSCRQLALCCDVAYLANDCHFSSAVIRHSILSLPQLFETSVTDVEKIILESLVKLVKKESRNSLILELEAADWNNFLHHALEFRFIVAVVLELLSLLVPLLYVGGVDCDSSNDYTPFDTAYELIWSHSDFLSTIHSGNEDTKSSLVQLMIQIVENLPSVCEKTHLPIFLTSYYATRRNSDRGILYLVHMYETNGIAVGKHRPFLWGLAAAEQHRLREEAGSWLLWKQPGTRDVIDNLDKTVLKVSTEKFPLDVALQPTNPFLDSSRDTADIYDPCFLLPLISHLLDTSCVVDCRQFVDSGCLSYLIVSLCSEHEDVRTAGGHALTRFALHLEGSKFKEKVEIHFILKVLRNSLQEGGQLTAVFGVFLAKCVVLLLHPDHPLYPIVAHFIVYKPVLDMSDLPLCSVLLQSSSIEHSKERAWMLEVLTCGLKSKADVVMYAKRDVFAQVLSLCGAGMLDRRCLINLSGMLNQATSLQKTAVTSVLLNSGIMILWQP